MSEGTSWPSKWNTGVPPPPAFSLEVDLGSFVFYGVLLQMEVATGSLQQVEKETVIVLNC